MNEILFFKTFSLVGGMLLITSIGARINKAYETTFEAVLTIGGTFLSLFVVYSLRDNFPTNLFALSAFSFCIGWSMGPTITMFGERFKFRKYQKKIGLNSKVVEKKKSFWGDNENKKKLFSTTRILLKKFLNMTLQKWLRFAINLKKKLKITILIHKNGRIIFFLLWSPLHFLYL